MRFVSLVQGSPRWHEWRAGGIGGSDAAAILGLSPWCAPLLLWQRKTGRAPEQEVSFAMRRGQKLEPVARRLYEGLVGWEAPPVCVEHPTRPWLRVSLDGLDPWGDVPLEIKCPNGDAHRLALDGRVPDYYAPQVQFQLLVTGARVLHYVSYNPSACFGAGEQLSAPVEVRPDPAMFALLSTFTDRFVQCWRDDTPPDWTTVAGAVPGAVPTVERPKRRKAVAS